jgi:hypothetical protein
MPTRRASPADSRARARWCRCVQPPPMMLLSLLLLLLLNVFTSGAEAGTLVAGEADDSTATPLLSSSLTSRRETVASRRLASGGGAIATDAADGFYARGASSSGDEYEKDEEEEVRLLLKKNDSSAAPSAGGSMMALAAASAAGPGPASPSLLGRRPSGTSSSSRRLTAVDAPYFSVSQIAKMVTADGAAGDDQFGYSVAIDGDTMVIGAYWDDDKGTNSESAYIYTRDVAASLTAGWMQRAKLVAGDGAAGDYFGYSVAISGDTVAVGAQWDDDKGANSGSAYIFTRDVAASLTAGWTQRAKLVAGDGAAGDYLGVSVAICGDTVAVGAVGVYRDDDKGSSGSAYIFASLPPPSPSPPPSPPPSPLPPSPPPAAASVAATYALAGYTEATFGTAERTSLFSSS